MFLFAFALFFLALGAAFDDAVGVASEVDDILCSGDTGTIEPSTQGIVDRVIQRIQGARSLQFTIRLIRKRLKDPKSGLRRLFGSAAANPRDNDENLDEAPISGTINKEMLDFIGKIMGQTSTVIGYLWNYGFIAKVLNQSRTSSENYNGVIPPCAVTNAVKEFQRFNQITPVNGMLTKETRDLMAKDRCGNHDVECETPECLAEDALTQEEHLKRKKRYVVKSRIWLEKEKEGQIVLRYFIDPEQMYDPVGPRKKHHDLNMGEDIVREQIEKAFLGWTKHAPIHFVEVDNALEADVKISFGQDEHGERRTGSYFDGQYGTLAHMYYPRSGKMHFDEAENFTASAVGPGINLEFVAAHEMGHGLGIKHSSVEKALMAPYYWGHKDEMLEEDDIAAIQALYGSNGTGSVVTLKDQGL